MTRFCGLSLFRALIAIPVAIAAWGVTPSSASANLIQWLAEVNSGSPAPVFVATNVFTPSIVDIGALSGDITYEFLVNGQDRAAAGSLIGSLTGGQNEAIRFEQWHNTGTYGATKYSVADYDFFVPTTYDTDVVLDFVVNSAAGTTRLFVNGVDSGATVPFALTLHGPVAFGGTAMPGGGFLGDDSFAGTIIGFASYDGALSSTELKKHADAFFAVVPEPSTWTTLLTGGIACLIGRRCQKRKK